MENCLRNVQIIRKKCLRYYYLFYVSVIKAEKQLQWKICSYVFYNRNYARHFIVTRNYGVVFPGIYGSMNYPHRKDSYKKYPHKK